MMILLSLTWIQALATKCLPTTSRKLRWFAFAMMSPGASSGGSYVGCSSF
jgi:hypothetical protein